MSLEAHYGSAQEYRETSKLPSVPFIEDRTVPADNEQSSILQDSLFVIRDYSELCYYWAIHVCTKVVKTE